MEIPAQNLDNELLQRIEEVSSLCEQIERAVDALVQRHGDRSEIIGSARALQVSATALKRELLQHYLEHRSAGTPGRNAANGYRPSMLTLDKEQQVINALLAVGSFETEQSIRAEGNHAIRHVLNCSADEAEKILDDLQASKLIEPDIARGGQLDARQPMPTARWRWSRPSTQARSSINVA